MLIRNTFFGTLSYDYLFSDEPVLPVDSGDQINNREEVIQMTEAQARHIWEVLLDVSGQKDVIVEVRPAAVAEEERKEAVA